MSKLEQTRGNKIATYEHKLQADIKIANQRQSSFRRLEQTNNFKRFDLSKRNCGS
ncbi:hypothetical protein APA_1765 [Pseudanabaena sp. lw0831]|nr:hypothetical protein APA_1765 [Pseudanabaena sp. lw0831]